MGAMGSIGGSGEDVAVDETMSVSISAGGMYALKPWYAERLAGIRTLLVRQGVSPNVLSVAGITFGALAGVCLWWVPQGWAALMVAPLLAARLAAANLDGAVARDSDRQTPAGSVLNEVGDRAAELAVLAGCLALAPGWLVLLTMLAASTPSWIALACAAAGLERPNGGPVGKTERCLLLGVLAAVPGSATVLLVVITVGSVLTAVLRAVRMWR